MPGRTLLIIAGFLVGLTAAFVATALFQGGSLAGNVVPFAVFAVGASLLTHATRSARMAGMALLLPALPFAVYLVRSTAAAESPFEPAMSAGVWVAAVAVGCLVGKRLPDENRVWNRSRSGWMLVGLMWLALVVVGWRLG